MKIAGVLLSLVVILLSVVPCCWDSCEEDGTMSQVETTSETSNVCSPFLSCGSCAGFVLQDDFTEVMEHKVSVPSVIDHKENRFQSVYSFKVWQPPKEVYEINQRM